SNLTLSYSQYKSTISLEYAQLIDSNNIRDYSKINYKYYNYIKDLTARVDYDYIADRRNTLRFGAFGSFKYFAPGATATEHNRNGVISNDTSFGASKAIPTQELALYLEDEFRLSNDVKITYGGRLVTYFQKDERFVYLEPRFSINKKINNRFAIKGSYTVMNQNMHLLADNVNSSGLLSVNFDRWIPASSFATPQRSQQITLGISQPFKNDFELSIESYYKKFDRILEIKEGADINGGILTENDWESKVLTGKGWNYGVEAFLQKRRGDITGWISYSLAWAKRNTPGVNRNENYFFQFDRRHYVNLVTQFKINDVYTGSINVVFSTGNVQSVPIGKYLDINGNVVYDYTEKNNYRLPNTFRIDVGLTKARQRSYTAESGYRFSIYNLLARNNPAYIYINNSNNPPQAYQRSFLSFIPGITYYTKF
ncbi:MAG: TonB-dependent receptor, partial [Bacteroidia bacterium]|nr:TonB-dependent receptor [Bacteroidia bacterium]